ncbi:MAG: hypothetical protein QOC72_3405 [Methylobacteriaceae bacterium]|jgi:hypothetical protein|nr:hypothetical protein [Methylobacteriaceae bacterium]
MAVFWITFRLEDSGTMKPSYEQRYKALMDAIEECATQWWLDPTSFIAFESGMSAEGIATVAKTAINPAHDMFLLRNMDVKDAVICGKTTDQDIFKLIPYLKKV